ncbi:MAG TPA: MBL fold metallo-hydrolase [Spirochaetota bacterium]|nr:MBL fold metallo-hydrolase [Spirochaetota bacterium]HOL57968.1 MBL fold metallo-hydrolase [Spirochaetota bacterium]HPP05476.1 MBL fold metallo-hydrolase [Spirochaetota bacterium]
MKKINNLNLEVVFGGNLGVNCYILEKENNIILVDFVPEVEDIIKRKSYNLDMILLTHIHFDHFEGLFDFQSRYNFKLILSKYAYERINNKYYNLLVGFPHEIVSFIKDVELKNATIVKDMDTLKWRDTDIQIVETPGHSEDSLVFIIHSEKIVFTGDTIFYGSIGRTDLPGSNESQIFKSIKKIFSLIDDDYTLYPGHGQETNPTFEKRNNFFIKNMF